MDNNLVFDETCPVCGQGSLVAVKNPMNGELLIMCDDCEEQWRSPEDAKSYKNVMARNEVVRVVDASLDEIKAVGWDKYLIHPTS